jgi:thiosulfate/3-mercaptopyruvate sulfurtransferase
MARQILVSPTELDTIRKDSGYVIFDCRFDLKDTQAGFNAYLEAHIPGAVYAHLDDDLSSPTDSTSGRHPLPDKELFASFLARSGWCPGKQVLVYDDAGGSIAARLWWLMKYFGHDCAAMLDGGINAWRDAGYELECGQPETAAQSAVSLCANENLAYSTRDITEGLSSREIVLIDARAAERFAGELEPIDPVAGHIPGAVNYPFLHNLAADSSFQPATKLREVFRKLAEGNNDLDLVHMCGSGVTACSNIFAAELAGIKDTKLYVGSWSEWIRDPSRPVEP